MDATIYNLQDLKDLHTPSELLWSLDESELFWEQKDLCLTQTYSFSLMLWLIGVYITFYICKVSQW